MLSVEMRLSRGQQLGLCIMATLMLAYLILRYFLTSK